MTQIRRFNWLDDDLTASLNKANQEAIPSGRYAGFAWDGANSLLAILNHTTNGMSIINSDDPITTINNVGEWRTKQGGIIQETNGVTVNFDAPDTLSRIDIVVGQHKYIQSTGGAAATYLIIKGIPATTPVAPTLTIPDQQTILGEMFIPGGGTALEDSTYTIAAIPNFGNDNTVAHLDRTQTFLEENVISQMTAEYGVCFLDIAGSKIDLSKNAAGIALVDDELRRNLKKNKFLLSTITATPTTITSIEPYPHEFILEAKQIEFFTYSPLVLSGSLFYEHHFKDVQIPTLSSFKLLTIEDTLGTGTLANTWKIINGGEATINGENNFTAINSWNKVTGSINASDVVLHSDGGNFVEVPTTPSTNEVKGITGFKTGGGTYMILKGDGEPLKLIHNTSDPISKKLWLPHGKAFTSFNENETFLFVEDVDYWRLVGTYNQVDDWHYVGESTGLGTTFIDYANQTTLNATRFKKNPNNTVTIEGIVDKSVLTDQANNLVFTLPIGYIPSRFYVGSSACEFYNASTGAALYTGIGRLDINNSGEVRLSSNKAIDNLSTILSTVSNASIIITINLD